MFDRRLWQEARATLLPILLTVLLHSLTGLVTVGSAFLLSRVVDAVFMQGQTRAAVQPLLLALLALILVRAALTAGAELVAGRLALRIKTSLRQRLFHRLLELGPVHSSGERSGELSATLVAGVEALESYFSHYLPQLAIAVLVPLTIFVAVFPVDLLTAIIFLLTAPLIPIFMILIGKVAAQLTGRQWRALSLMSANFLDVLQGLTTLKQLGRSRAQVEQVALVSDRFRRTTLSVLRVTFLSALTLELVATLSVAIVAVEIALRLLRGGLPFADALFILVLAPEFYQPLRQLGARFHAGMEGISAAQRIFAILDRSPETPGGSRPAPEPPFTITFENVHAAYGDEREPALKGVSFTLEPGSRSALTGPSGAGKSTVLQLLLGFLRPTAGRILVNGLPLDSFTIESWRSHIAWVPQNPYLFYDTVAGNIRLGRPGASRAEVEEAARLACAHDFITALSQGYETVVGEQGVRLSGGQAQRIALARAFLQDAPLLLMDEPTSQLDPRTEAELQQATARLLAGRTALIIAHRESTIAGADQILRLCEGELEVLAGASSVLDNGYYTNGAPEQPKAPAREPSLRAHEAGKPPSPAGAPRPAPAQSGRQLLRHLVEIAGKRWPHALLAAILGTLTIGSNVSLMATSAYLISAAALQPSIADLNVAVVGVRFFGLSRAVFRYLERLASHNLTFHLLARWRTWFYAALEPLAPARLQQYRSGDLLSRIVGDVAALEAFYVRGLGPPLVAILVTAGVALFFAAFDGTLALALVLFLLLAGVLLPLVIARLNRGLGQQITAHRARLETLLVDGVQGMADLLAAGRGAGWEGDVASAARSVASVQRRASLVNAVHGGTATLLQHLAAWSVLWLAIPLVTAGQIGGVNLAVLVLAALAAFEAVQPLPAAAQQMGESLAAARRLMEVVQSEPAVRRPPAPAAAPVRPHLAVRHLSFRYEPESPPALQDVTLDLPPGRRLAVVGPSGAGKSTLINLLLRFWEFDAGEILLDGQDVRSLDPDDVRRFFGVIAQRPHLFNATLRDNIRLPRPKASMAEIVAAAQAAQLHDFVLTLPEGYETTTGERGLQLSGGQRQRVAVARALLQDAPILLLDEPTAHLDPATETALLQTVFRQAQGRSLVLVTHRLAGMEQMDEIIVLDGGRIVERGAHETLLAQGGLYAQMWRLQHGHLAG